MPDLPLQQSQQEFQHMANLQRARADSRRTETSAQSDDQPDDQQSSAKKTNSFPKGMLIWAICFDLIGLIPIVNVVTEPVASFMFYRWQKKYAPNTGPLKTLIISKVIDLITVGILPSNSIVVLRAYSKNKTANMV